MPGARTSGRTLWESHASSLLIETRRTSMSTSGTTCNKHQGGFDRGGHTHSIRSYREGSQLPTSLPPSTRTLSQGGRAPVRV